MQDIDFVQSAYQPLFRMQNWKSDYVEPPA